LLGDHRRPCAGAPVPQTGYLEPLLAGATLAISPLPMLFAVFFWSFLWGIPGAFIGVPATIAMLTMCAQYAGSR
jgi:predicted PurR-regulated permease PerM